MLDGRELRVRVDKGKKYARPREARARGPPAGKTVDPTKIFVTNLSVDAGQGDYLLREHCSSVGEVPSVELLMRGYNGTVPTGSAVGRPILQRRGRDRRHSRPQWHRAGRAQTLRARLLHVTRGD